MSDAFTSAGTRLYVCASQPTTHDETGFESLNWTEVGEISDLGEFGRVYNKVTFNPLASRGTVKRKGSYDEGALSLTLARVPSDSGQAILVNGLNSDNSYSFKITLNNAGGNGAGYPTTFYNTGQIMSYTCNVGSVDSITTGMCQIEFDNNFVEVAATATTTTTTTTTSTTTTSSTTTTTTA